MTSEQPRRPSRLRGTSLLLTLLILIGAVAPAALHAQPRSSETTVAPSAEEPRYRLSVRQPRTSLPEGGTMRIEALANVPAGTDYLEVRLRVLRPGGGLLHQNTEVRHETSSTVRFIFERRLEDLEMDAGKYPYEVQMRATGSEPLVVTGFVIVYDRMAPPVRLTVVTRFGCTPGLDPQGRFVLDPAHYTRSRDEMTALESLLAEEPRLKVSAAVAPLLLDDWAQAAAGYRFAGPEGLQKVSSEDSAALSYARALETARDLAGSRQVDFLHVPYADPDVIALQRMDALDDLALHYSEGLSAYARSLGTTPSPVTTLLASRLPKQAVPTLRAAGLKGAVLDASSLCSGEGTVPPGLYRVARNVKVLAWDPEITRALAEGDETRLVAELYDRSAEPSVPVAAVLDLGTGAKTDLATVGPILQRLAALPWVRFETATRVLESTPTAKASLRERYTDDEPAPAGYWDEVAEGRRMMNALHEAAGQRDRDASEVRRDVLIAESRFWAGPDESWSLADRGRAFAASAARRASGIFRGLRLEGRDITLSGTRGVIPVSISNTTGRDIRVRLVLSARYASFPKGPERALRLRKAENYVTLPVDLGSALSDSVQVSLVAGDEIVAEQTIRVRGSVLDKIGLVGMVAIVLVGMLLFIRKRVRSAAAEEDADAGTMGGRGDR